MTTTVVHVYPDVMGIARLGRTEQVQAAAGHYGEDIADRARSLSPYDASSPGPHFRDNIVVETGEDDDTAFSTVTADVPHAVYVEFGTSDTPAFAPLRQAMESGAQGVE